jgi:hypothetical protein
LSIFGSGIAKDRSDAPGLSVGVDECAAFNFGSDLSSRWLPEVRKPNAERTVAGTLNLIGTDAKFLLPLKFRDHFWGDGLSSTLITRGHGM